MTLPDGSRAAEIVRVPFQGTEIHTTLVSGEPHVVIRPTLEGLGLDYSAQLKKLKTKSWATVATTATVAEDGKVREMTTVDLDTWAMLLANVDEHRVAPGSKQIVIDYQRESARALREYWTNGGAINPRATEDQLTAIISRAEGQARVLRALDGIVDATWLEAKARHVAARALGEEPEIDLTTRPLTVGEYLEEKGVSGKALRSISPKFGGSMKRLYIAQYGVEPGKTERFVDGALRNVAVYTEAHRPMFDAVYRELIGRVAA
ncbi:hypothetical protein GCM10010172_04600 [Paractinoplanes ferrugineus]|uniref:Antirepressor protein ant N-terminal domain-containing protein n=1 Tax=Paractinoplanes ferrugineus TaxID=113564 RepID=A0A919MLH9_9ACTN|nr:hypothetical protein Afe05nite_86850 [Actinoplanes ferrugineus]